MRRTQRLIGLTASLALGCHAAFPPTPTHRDPELELRPPGSSVVVLVPGATGSLLRQPDGPVVWGRGLDVLLPRDGGYALVRPVAAAGAQAPLEALAVIERIRLAGVVRKPVYEPLLRALEALGYRRGELSCPRCDGTLLPFAWDWRSSHASAAAHLAESLEAVRRARGLEVLPVALVCQSSGAHLCRFFAKYGGASLEDVEAGHAAPPERIAVTRLVLVGSSNGGGLRVLRELDRGRRYVPIIGRKFQPETLFTFPSLYEDLPAYRADLFVDRAGRALDIDLYEAANWTTYGWSAFGAAARRRLARLEDHSPFGTEAQRLDYLRSTLDRAQRFQRALLADAGWSRGPSYHLIQGRSDPATPERAVLARAGGAWRLLFAGDAAVDRDPLLRHLATGVGDGHATLASQLWLGPEETAALAGPPVYVPGAHFEMILSSQALAALATALAE
ncbi:MAG TPA: hypothetical protein VMS86_03220 [Thermoanaerobaculia bacterium]|nr:hypothetical protein [Thermoanaerobaculia bacterium]